MPTRWADSVRLQAFAGSPSRVAQIVSRPSGVAPRPFAGSRGFRTQIVTLIWLGNEPWGCNPFDQHDYLCITEWPCAQASVAEGSVALPPVRRERYMTSRQDSQPSSGELASSRYRSERSACAHSERSLFGLHSRPMQHDLVARRGRPSSRRSDPLHAVRDLQFN
jgi:hypothetical protein